MGRGGGKGTEGVAGGRLATVKFWPVVAPPCRVATERGRFLCSGPGTRAYLCAGLCGLTFLSA